LYFWVTNFIQKEKTNQIIKKKNGVSMKNSNLFVLGMLLLGMIFLGFQCSSTELTSAKLYIQQKNWDKALETLQTEVQNNPKSDEGYYLMGTVYSELDKTDEMVDAFDKSLAISNKFADKIGEFRAYQWAQNYNRGVNLFQRGNQTTDPDSSKMYYDMAIEAYNKAITLEPDSAETYRNLAFAYLTTGKTEESIDPLKKLIELEEAEEGYQYLGEVYYALGSNTMTEFKLSGNTQDSVKAMEYFDAAIATLQEGLNKYPDNSEMLGASTNAYIGANRIDEAITSAKAQVEKEPDNAVYHYNYGVLLLNVENFEKAETELLRAIELDPNYENAIYNIGVTYVKWGTAINKEAEAQGMISEDYKQKYQKALPYLEQVVEQDPDEAQMWELLGKVYGVLGMNDDANNAFKKADELR
jgi:tetratricopeptide (TPR) repeat protein